MAEINDSAAESDMVPTAPHYTGVGPEILSYNPHNFEICDRLSRIPFPRANSSSSGTVCACRDCGIPKEGS